MADETTLWKGSTSQLVHFWTYVIWLLIAVGIAAAATFLLMAPLYGALLIPMFGILIRWYLTKATVYELTTQRLRVSSGLLGKKLDELELYRVKDTTLDQPFLLRVFGLGNITVMSSDANMPTVILPAVPGAYKAREKLRLAVEAERDRKRVRDVEFTESSSDKAAELATDHDLAHGMGDVGHPGH